MKSAARKGAASSAGAVLKAAQFKAEALAIMRRVHETGQPVTVTSRGKPLVRVEPVRDQKARIGYGSMKGTVEILVPDDQLVSGASSAKWATLQEWDEILKS
jgi:prevent-host-death family protein